MEIASIALPLHLISLVYVAWNVVRADHMGFNWIRGKIGILDENIVNKYHRGSWLGLGMMIVTGSLLFWPMREFLLSRPQFYVKMGFVTALLINGLVIGHLSKLSTTKTFSSLSLREKIPLFISGAVSTVSWIGAALGGLFLIPE
ncbi:hypothetical protein K9M47_00575 [Candidatus Gracilibacteria bacterium]|nr:hypothetical protein [Candidatus Gracilibacteria bacterium]MCF7898637.1 hypothetical protein [Candidatus Paceibacterota bacterium]